MNSQGKNNHRRTSGTSEIEGPKGFVPTPIEVVDLMVGKLFSNRSPNPEKAILDPGCGTGNFIAGIIRWCEAHQASVPNITGIELNPYHVAAAKERFSSYASVKIEHGDFLSDHSLKYDYVVGNPPYVPITGLGAAEKKRYRTAFLTASGRFDLYLLFFEQALRSLNPGGKLVLITPEKFLYVETAAPLRKLLTVTRLEEILLLREDTFGDLVTYPTITALTNSRKSSQTKVVLRDGRTVHVSLPRDGSSWLPMINGTSSSSDGNKLFEICRRVSCGVATGADSIFVKPLSELEPKFRPFAFPTLSGRELAVESHMVSPKSCLLIPYARDGSLLGWEELGALQKYLSDPQIRHRLMQRTCATRKVWYAYHETPVLDEILRPKILCKDITSEPHFWIDRKGTIVPRHSIYYIVPEDPSMLDELADYLNSPKARDWLLAHCQRASKGFLRIQSRILKNLPLPQRLTLSSSRKNANVRTFAPRIQSTALVAVN